MKLREGLSRVKEVFPLPFKCKSFGEPSCVSWILESGCSGHEHSPWPLVETFTGREARLFYAH